MDDSLSECSDKEKTHVSSFNCILPTIGTIDTVVESGGAHTTNQKGEPVPVQ